MNRQGIVEERLRAAVESNLVNKKSKITGRFHEFLTCPECGKNEFYAHWPAPHKGWCNRKNNCSASETVVGEKGYDLKSYFNIQVDFLREFPPTKKDPHAPAREWLVRERGIPRHIVDESGVVFKEVYVKDHGKYPAVGFPLKRDGDKIGKYNWKIFNPPPGESNSRFDPGCSWQGTYFDLAPDYDKPCYVTEACIKTQALAAAEVQSISVNSSGANPKKYPGLKRYSKIILAGDNDPAGWHFAEKWSEEFPGSECIFPPPGFDWDSLALKVGFKNFPAYFEERLPEFETYAKLKSAGKAHEHAEIYFAHFKRPAGLFQFKGSTWFSWLKEKNDEKTVCIERFGRFTYKPISRIKDDKDPFRPSYRYHLVVKPLNRPEKPVIGAGNELTRPASLGDFFFDQCGVALEGGKSAVTAFNVHLATEKTVREVKIAKFTAYDKETGWYIFANYGVAPTGELHKPDKDGLYRIDPKNFCMPPEHAHQKAISPAAEGPTVKEIVNLIFGAFGEKGILALDWFVAAWFVWAIEDELNFFPFLSLHGDVQSGKSTLTLLLNHLQGFNSEGTTVSSANSRVGVQRVLGRNSSWPSSVIEGNRRDDKASFDYDSLLPLFNRNPYAIKGEFSNDMRSREIPFAGALMFSANREVFQGKAERERVVSVPFERESITPSTTNFLEKIHRISKEIRARVSMLTLRNRRKFEENWFKEFERACKDLATVDNRRVRENHAILLSFHRIFCQVHGIKGIEMKPYIEQIALKKQATSDEEEWDEAADFFEKVDRLNEDKTVHCLFLDQNSGKIYINLTGAVEAINNTTDTHYHSNKRLWGALAEHPAYVERKRGYRFPEGEKDPDGRVKQCTAWIFDAKKMK